MSYLNCAHTLGENLKIAHRFSICKNHILGTCYNHAQTRQLTIITLTDDTAKKRAVLILQNDLLISCSVSILELRIQIRIHMMYISKQYHCGLA